MLYVDYQCQACRVFEQETLPILQRDYVDTGRVLLAWRPFPLASRGRPAGRQILGAVTAVARVDFACRPPPVLS